MPLVERLMGYPFIPDESGQKIQVHTFFAAQVELIAGRVTRPQIKAYWNMDTATATEYDALCNLAPGNTAAQALFVERVHATFILAEDKVPGYSTPTEVRTKLGI